MPVPRRAGIGRRPASYDTRHFAFLVGGIDWPFMDGDDRWANLESLDDDALRAEIESMAACWNAYGEFELRQHTEGMYHPWPCWFAEYASDLHRLFCEFHKQREWMAYQRAHGYSLETQAAFEQQYTPPAEAPSAAVQP